MLDGELLHRLCQHYGIAEGYHDLSGHFRHAPRETRNALLAAFGVPVDDEHKAWQHLQDKEGMQERPLSETVVLRKGAGDLLRPQHAANAPWLISQEDGETLEGTVSGDGVIDVAALPLGYHTITLWPNSGRTLTSHLIVAPVQAKTIGQEGKSWGLTVPLYGLRSDRNWGVGDFGDLADLAVIAAAEGADFIGINPVHALFPLAPDAFSPYSPSSREFLNVMHIAPDQIPELRAGPDGRKVLKRLRARKAYREARAVDLVDYVAVYSLKIEAYEHAFDIFKELAAESPRWVDFEAFLGRKGRALWRHCIYEALAEHLGGDDGPLYDWQRWPEDYQDPNAAAVAAFEARCGDRIRFYAYLQWIAAEQLGRAHDAACGAGMSVGLYLDLAVGMVPGGAEAWTNPVSIVKGMSLGAPGDDANPEGQKWHLSPLSPEAMRHSGFALFRKTLANIMVSAGMIRIDHILGANRSFWAPLDGQLEGGYVAYPFDELLSLIALESERSNCLVVGEDLGMVPEGFRDALANAGLMGCSLFLFERYEDGSFKQPYDYSSTRLASLSNHDFPTITGFLEGDDLKWREELAIGAAPDQLAAAHDGRNTDRFRIRAMLADRGLLKGDDNHSLNVALHEYIASSDAGMIAVQIEDLCGQVAQMNVPGTTTEKPNWRRKLVHPIETIFTDAHVLEIVDAVRRQRPANDDTAQE